VASQDKTALVMSGGGARGAYQVGVLLGLQELGVFAGGRQPFDILVGTSAGSINCTLYAAYCDEPNEALAEMHKVWSTLQSGMVFRTGPRAILGNAFRWVRDLALGGLLGRVRGSRSLLDTRPFRRLLLEFPWHRLDRNLQSRHFEALGVLATNYTTGNGVLFLQDHAEVPTWQRVRYRVKRAAIRTEHVLASSAIPIIFPPVALDKHYYGDGSLRNTAPLGPAIQLGANRIVAVGVREAGTVHTGRGHGDIPKLADVVGVLLDAVLLDAIEVDVQHCLRLNRLAEASNDFKPVDVLWLRPHASLAALARDMENLIPPLIHYLLRGLGDDVAIAELASYLIFDGLYCERLIDQGRRDVRQRQDEVREFFKIPSLPRRL
jgi:NTE family protein